ncbi:hypothetical protein DHEL01_v211597 [Diaporthe helianthi]|uniref:Uncharacterized protein n=1 Tax=Diaporthe helianthi TaxID=158607 RepID=A0A2P5HIC8_DIAHE|nr:hypothetical protein DHEL01_v211597 [Diaporthe helianthi]
MTEHDASPQQQLPPPPSRRRPSSQDHHAAPASPETGESSASGSVMNNTRATDATDATLAQRPSHDDVPANGHAGRQMRSSDIARESKRQHRQSRPQKPRSGGAFLLSDPFEDAVVDDTRHHKHRSRRTAEKGKIKSHRTSTQSDDPTQNGRHSSLGLGLGLSPGSGNTMNGSAERPPRTSPGALGGDPRQERLLESPPRPPSPRKSTSSLDMESTQIVNMALNLSESRRMAQTRNVSQPLPPRLVPLATDNAVAGSLRQQLQQQRRVSRTMSPKPERGTLSRLGSSGRTSSLQPAFDPTRDGGGYRYHFSGSTLARAQKAKDYMELLAQYRRALELLPPLKPNTLSKTSTMSDHALSISTSGGPLNFDTASQIGRPYNPLQYIRNRKVRARERKTIDGETQGFGDVSRVTDWVDDVAKWVATRQMRTPGSSTLPPFAGADIFNCETSPPSHVSRTSNAVTKPKRPRNDWTIEPADLIADIYWLEQDDHKRLVEDRNWRRVFPQDSGLYRPLSQATNDVSPAAAFKTAQLQFPGPGDGPGKSTVEAKAAKNEQDHTSGGTRERARQKLQELRSFHRHTNSAQGHSHNPLRRRDSSSSSSSSDSDSQKKRSRKNTIDIDKDILEKQMMEMIAREEAEQNEARLSQEPELKKQKSLLSNSIRPDHLDNSDSTGGSRQHSRRGSLSRTVSVEGKDFAKRPKITSSQRPSRESLDVPPYWGRPSLESESSVPNSPEARKSRRDNYFIPGIGAELSPASSRTGSPSRNPFSKVKHMFRDRSRERASERQHDMQSSEKEDSAEVVATHTDRLSSTPEVDKRGRSRSRNNSVGPELKAISTRLTGDSQKSHRKTNNTMRLSDTGAGLRGLFKAPRIESVLKSGVSKVSELIWKKESEAEAEASDSSTSSSDGTDADERGRRKHGKSLSPTASIRGRPRHTKQETKHFLDIMPPFVPASDSRDHGPTGAPLSRPASRRSTRFDLLKPPRIDISIADSDTQKDPAVDVSDIEKRMANIHEGPLSAGRRPGTAFSGQSPKTRRFSAAFNRDSRHFSLSEQSSAPECAPLTRREVARMKAYMLSSGVMAMNISRRHQKRQVLDVTTTNESSEVLSALGNRVSWPEITQLVPEDQRQELLSKPISEADLFPVTARVLGTAIQTSRQRWESAAESFRHRTRSDLVNGQIEPLRTRIQLDLSAMTRTAAEEADEVSGDLVDGQRRKVKAVVDVIDKLSRRRRRRFRWARRAGWLALEWALVGFMWYVWLVVMIARVFLGVGKGFVRGVRWLLWL